MLSVDLYTAFKQILFSFVFFLDVVIFFSYQLILETKKIVFSSVIFNIQKGSVSPFSSVDRLVHSPASGQVAATPFAAYRLKLYSSRDCVASVSPPSC